MLGNIKLGGRPFQDDNMLCNIMLEGSPVEDANMLGNVKLGGIDHWRMTTC